jgi:hypothetical protein
VFLALGIDVEHAFDVPVELFADVAHFALFFLYHLSD